MQFEIAVIALDLSTQVNTTKSIKINANTQKTTRLDPEEIIEGKRLGEGSFGVVFKGEFQGNTVAIKNAVLEAYKEIMNMQV